MSSTPRARRSRRPYPTDRSDTPSSDEDRRPRPVAGSLRIDEEGRGWVESGPTHAFVPAGMVRGLGLRAGDVVEGETEAVGGDERRAPALARVERVSGMSPEAARGRPRFEDLTPVFPDEMLRLDGGGSPGDPTARVVDLVAPIGKGQRGLIVAPPKAGKTSVLRQIAGAIERNHPEVRLLVLLIDERPEEVTELRRAVSTGEVVASTFDRPAREHVAVAEATFERAKRMVELGLDVVVLLDGVTRLARAYNMAARTTGRVLSGGVDAGALYPPKRLFGAARNVEEGGSLTVLATALVETGSRMDEVIFEEFKGTGNMELKLDRRLAERRLYPAVDVAGSSTRHEELLVSREELAARWRLRRVLGGLADEGREAAALEMLIERLRATETNAEFLTLVQASAAVS